MLLSFSHKNRRIEPNVWTLLLLWPRHHRNPIQGRFAGCAGAKQQVVNRPNPKIELGPVDMSAAFIVVDALKFDLPIVYASHSFERLTGYCSDEVKGKNCRFLQAPGGYVQKGEQRHYSDNSVIFKLKSAIDTFQECQYMNINFRKSGEPFVNVLFYLVLSSDSAADHGCAHPRPVPPHHLLYRLPGRRAEVFLCVPGV